MNPADSRPELPLIPPYRAVPGMPIVRSEDFNAMVDGLYAAVNAALEELYAAIDRLEAEQR